MLCLSQVKFFGENKMQFTGLGLLGILAYNGTAPVEFKVYVENEPLFTECRLQDETTYAGRRFLCLNEKNEEVIFEIKEEVPEVITK